MKSKRPSLAERAEMGIVVFDGAMGTMLQAAALSESDWDGKSGCSEILNFTRPDVIRSIHEAYFAAGSDVVETNSFGANEIVLAEFGIPDRARELARISATLAREAADKWSDPDQVEGAKPRYVAGSMGPGTKLISLGQTTWDAMLHSYKENALGLIEGGADLILVETCQDPLQIKCAIAASRDAMAELGKELPVIVTVTVETTGTLLMGTDIEAAFTVLEPMGLFALGLNCATGPADMRPHVQRLSQLWPGRLLVQPNAGLPQNQNGKLVYTLGVGEYVDVMSEFVESFGVGLVGGCCGTNPLFIQGLSAAVRGENPKARPLKAPRRDVTVQPAVASLFSAQKLVQTPPAFWIGERTNTNGSKQFRELLLKNDYEALVEMGLEQASTGIHGLDLCVAYTGRNESADMHEAIRRFALRIDVPLVIDSTELAVIELALKNYGGRAIINSINLEDGEGRANAVCALAKRYGAALIALTIDEGGMAREAAKKLSIAKRIHDIAVTRHGMRPSDLIFDALTFTLGAGDETLRTSALETIEGISLIKKELPGVLTVLGLSNVSFGFAPVGRRVLNSVFVSRCIEAGLDMAIVNLKHIVPLAHLKEDDKRIAANLIDNVWPDGKDPVFDFIRHFTGAQEEEVDDKADAEQTNAQRLNRAILRGSKSGLPEILGAAMRPSENEAARTPIGIINDVLIPAMKEVGELFGSGKMQLPFVLQSAEVMKAAVDYLTPFMEKVEGEEQLSIVLATVRGDVHDIGKNLVDIILSNNGYKVFNLGIKCEIETIIQKAVELKASAIGLSGLLVKSTTIMRENVEELARRDISLPVLLGGAALTPGFVSEQVAPLGKGPVAYCADAFEGLRVMNLLKDGALEDYLRAQREKARSAKPRARSSGEASVEKVPVDFSVPVPQAPFLGVRHDTGVALADVYTFLTEEVIFRGRWGFRRGELSKSEYDDLIQNVVRPEFERLKHFAAEGEFLRPAVAWGYFECNSEGEEVVIWDPKKPGARVEVARFSFPRQGSSPSLCIADYFRPASLGADLIALQIATVGPHAAEYSGTLYKESKYKDYLLFHGLSVECAEALAELQHKRIREEIGIAGDDGKGIEDFVVQKYRGSRYSFGYPACPDLEQNRVLCELLESHKIGVEVSEEAQMVPEQTTSGFVVHHPQAKYFAV